MTDTLQTRETMLLGLEKSKTYDKRDRAMKAAVAAIGGKAILGLDYEVSKTDTKPPRYVWTKLDPLGYQPSVKDRVHNTHDTVEGVLRPDVHGTVLVVGSTVSEVKWDPPAPWGQVQNCLNKHLQPVEDDKKEDPTIFPESKDDGGIPEFLKVKNRKPLTPEQQKKLEERQKTIGEIAEQKRDTRLPRNIEPAGLEILKQQQEPSKKDLKAVSTTYKVPATKVPGKLVKVPREGSRKHTVFTTFKAEGEAAATKKAVALGLAEGTAKSWLGKWKRAAL